MVCGGAHKTGESGIMSSLDPKKRRVQIFIVLNIHIIISILLNSSIDR